MKLTEEQELILARIRAESKKHHSGYLWNNQSTRSLLDIIATLQRDAATATATADATPDLGYKWDAVRRNWYPIEVDDGC